MGGTVSQVDNYDPNRWSKVEIEGICREFGYTTVSRLWFKMSSVNPNHANFHQVVDDDETMFMTDLVHGHDEIHVFVEHLVDEPVEAEVEDIEPLEVLQCSAEPLEVEVGHD